ncbi:coactosin-like protein [Asterias rubens]|uniref:coactosin-like protein n=1 Tax=Asterias rubens TaxID=7604 RepID=UPI001454E888|nr:coactosin-like protein [Asterias rubens]
MVSKHFLMMNRCVAKYNGKKIYLAGTGTDYSEFLDNAGDDERMYSYVRFQDVDGTTGARKKMYAFITWIGPSVSPLAKARVSTDKAFVKQIFTNFGKEILADDASELAEAKVLNILLKAEGAAYGTGK